jgi:hypothetical protein
VVTGISAEGTNASFIVMNNHSAPNTYRFTIGQPGDTLTPAQGGRILIKTPDGEIRNYLQAPWARDANGVELPTTYSIADGNVLVQHIDTEGATFPVVADPSTGCGVGWCSVYFNRSETKAIAAGGAVAVGAITAACALLGGPIAGGACAAMSGVIIAVAQGANANGNCLGIVGYGAPPALVGWNPFVLNKGQSGCN